MTSLVCVGVELLERWAGAQLGKWRMGDFGTFWIPLGCVLDADIDFVSPLVGLVEGWKGGGAKVPKVPLLGCFFPPSSLPRHEGILRVFLHEGTGNIGVSDGLVCSGWVPTDM